MGKRGPKPGSENAKHGGQVVKAKYPNHFVMMGRKGGKTHTREFLQVIGSRGGKKNVENNGREHMQAIGRKGGKK